MRFVKVNAVSSVAIQSNPAPSFSSSSPAIELWTCSQCTFVNPKEETKCQICENPKEGRRKEEREKETIEVVALSIEEEEEEEEEEENFCCPLTMEIMTDPVSTMDGITYER